MAGHSKWANIKHRKGAVDAKRGKMFTRIVKEITIAVKEHGPDPESNPRLRLALANAKGCNMPKDTMLRAIKKGSDPDTSNLQETTYEGYAAHGIGVFVECLTDNLNRTVPNIRSIFSKHGGSLGKNGSLSFLFDRKGIFIIPKNDFDKEELELELIDAGAEEIEENDDQYIIYTSFEDFGTMQKKLEEMKIEAESSKIERIPNNTTKLGIEESKSVLKLIDAFDDDDDVQNVYHNLELTEELENELCK